MNGIVIVCCFVGCGLFARCSRGGFSGLYSNIVVFFVVLLVCLGVMLCYRLFCMRLMYVLYVLVLLVSLCVCVRCDFDVVVCWVLFLVFVVVVLCDDDVCRVCVKLLYGIVGVMVFVCDVGVVMLLVWVVAATNAASREDEAAFVVRVYLYMFIYFIIVMF